MEQDQKKCKNDISVQDYKKALSEFLLDIECLAPLSKYIDGVNTFDVLKISRTEIRHSNMLAWLFNPLENHGLRDSFRLFDIFNGELMRQEVKFSTMK